jgi:hypothetical protein
MKLIPVIRTLLFVVLLFTSVQAQDLAKLLPANTFMALGIQDWISHRDKLQPFVDEFTRLELMQALIDLSEDSAGSSGGIADSLGLGEAPSEDSAASYDMSTEEFMQEWEKRFGDADLLDMFGQEAWIGVSATSSNPLPSITLLTKLTPEVSAQFAKVIAEELPEGAETLSEGDVEFYVTTDSSAEADAPFSTAAFTLQQDILMLSTNPDTLRGVLRQLAGSSDPNFTTSEGYTSSLATFESGNSYLYFDLPTIAENYAPLAKQVGFEQLIDRLAQAFNTAGVSAGVSRFTDEGTEGQGIQVVNPAGGDASLLALLTEAGTADRSVLQRAPADALAVSSSYSNLTGWWDYLNEIVAVQPELGGDLDTILQGFGLDLRSTFFSWVGKQFFSVTTGVAEAVEPGMAPDNLLGEAVYMFEASDEAAAQEGLTNLVQTISAQVAAFADPSGGTGDAAESTTEIAGATINNFEITSGVSLSYTVKDGYAFLATSQDAMTKVLENSGSLQDAEAVQGLLTFIPEDASSFTISNDQVTLQGTASQLSSSLQTTAGIGGASNLDFDKVEAASAKFEEFVNFVAERLGYSVSYSVQGENGVTSASKSEIRW